jgi:cytochrome P450
MLVRAAMVPTTLRGHRLRTGQVAIIPVFAIHRHRQLWDRPDVFDPNRFAPGASYDRGAFLPFGAGPRLCIAASFALTEIAVVVAELVKLFRFTPVGDAPVVSLKATTRSVNGLNVMVEASGLPAGN